MEKFIRQMRQVHITYGTEHPQPFFKTGYKITANAMIRELRRRKVSSQEIKQTRKFLRRIGYTKSGKERYGVASVYPEALNMHMEGRATLLEQIREIAIKLHKTAKANKLHTAAKNPAVAIAASTDNAKAFLDKVDVRESIKDIKTSELSSRAKQRLLRYLEEK